MRGAKMVSPVPTVTDAMIAPGPNTFSSASQPPLISRDGGGYSNAVRVRRRRSHCAGLPSR